MEQKPFELTLIYRSEDKIAFFEKVTADNLVELYSKLLITTVRLQEEIVKLQLTWQIDDDIPF